MGDDKLVALIVGSPAAMSLLIWLLKNSIAKNIRDVEAQIERAVTMGMQTQASVNDIQTRLAVYTEQLGALNRDVGGVEAKQDKLAERVDKLAEHWAARIAAIEATLRDRK